MKLKDIDIIKKTWPKKVEVQHRDHGIGQVVDVNSMPDGKTNIDVWFDGHPQATSFVAEKALLVIYKGED